MKRALVNKCALIKDDSNGLRGAWGWTPKHQYTFTYYHKKVAIVSFEGEGEVTVRQTFDPWSVVINSDNTKILCRLNRLEDEFHGVDLIDEDVMFALYMESQVNDNITRIEHPSDALTADIIRTIFENHYKSFPSQIVQLPPANKSVKQKKTTPSKATWKHYVQKFRAELDKKK